MSIPTKESTSRYSTKLSSTLTHITFSSRKSVFVGTSIILGLLTLVITAFILLPKDSGRSPSLANVNIQISNQEQGLAPIKVGEIELREIHLNYIDPQEKKAALHYPGASYIKIHISKLDLKPGDILNISNPDGTETYTYPGSLFTTDSEPGFWAISILGDTVLLEIQSAESKNLSLSSDDRQAYQRALSGGSLKELGVVIDKYARGYPEEQIQAAIGAPDSTCGTNQRADVICYQNSHPTEYEKSHAVARLLINNTYLCTAWRASSENRVFTNEHCVSSQTDVNGTEVRFNYDHTTCGGGIVASTTVVTGDTFLTDSYNYDFALFTVKNFDTITSFGYLEIDPRTPVLDEEIYIPQHGDGDPKQFGIESDMNTGNVCRIDAVTWDGRIANSDTGYYCDTIGGSSGSPVLARSNHQVIAIHHFGTGGATCNSSTMNSGVRMELIWPLVEQYFTTADVGPVVYDSHTIDDDNTGDSSGNGNGVAECGESIEMFVDLLNQGTDTATGVSTTISTSDSYVTWLDNTSSNYPDITGGGTATNTDDFDFSLAVDTPDGHVITFNLDTSASNGGPWADSFDVTVTCNPPTTPTNLNASAVSSTQIDISWQDNADNESAYYIERSPDGSTNWTEIDNVAANVTSYSDAGLNCSSEYYYRVRAYRSSDGQYSEYSNTASDTTYACQTMNFTAGWNLITLPLQPITPYQAQSLLDTINNQGGSCNEIDRWNNGGWESHISGETFNNFDINLGEGYFIKCAAAGNWTLEGTPLTSSIALSLSSGWNLIGVPYSSTAYVAQSLLDGIKNQGGVCSEADRWKNSGWDAHIDGLPFNNFEIINHEGYFIKCSQASNFTP
jgi:V8-like Glu-specific endopeptidase